MAVAISKVTERATEEQMQFAQAIVDLAEAGRERFGFGVAEIVSLGLSVFADIARGTYGPECLEGFSKLVVERQNFPMPPTQEELDAMGEAANAAVH